MAVGVTPFVRLKLRLIRNGMRGQTWRIVLFVLGIVFGVQVAIGGFVLFTVAGAIRGDAGVIIIGLAGSGLTLAWLLLPLLFFGVDETIDPARFALLPIPQRSLLRGMVVAACVSIPAAVTAVTLSGLVVGGAIRGGVPTAAVAVVGAALGLLLCVIGSRAVTSAFASMLRSRKVRDLAAILIAVLASSMFPLQLGVTALVNHSDLGGVARIARILAWTPLAAPYAAALDVADGRWWAALGKLAVAAGSVAALMLWWMSTLESAMIGGASGGRGRSGSGGRTGTAVTSLFPILVRILRPGRGTALMAREWRYWWRDPRRRAGLLSLAIAAVMLPVALRVGVVAGGSGTPLALAVVFSAVLAATLLSNQFGNDGSAYALHLLVAVPGRVELRARAAALVLLMAPLLMLATAVVGLLTGVAGQVPAALGVVAAALGVSTGVTALVSVIAPYAFPDSMNPFAVSSGTGSARGLVALVGSLGTLMLALPVILFAVLTHGLGPGLVVLGAGAVWGAAGLLLGTHIGGGLLDRRGPEVLVAVTPRR